MTSPPPRVSVLMARKAPQALIIRRGPSKWTHLILWDLERDHFTLGAWTKGKINPLRCALSADGRLLVYQTQDYGRRKHPESDHWTAVSRPPWLTALLLWPHDCFSGGGEFADDGVLEISGSTGRGGDIEYPSGPPPKSFRFEIGWWNESFGEVCPFAESWSGFDHKKRRIWIHSGLAMRSDMPEDRVLLDLNALQPDPKPSPEWARQWPDGM